MGNCGFLWHLCDKAYLTMTVLSIRVTLRVISDKMSRTFFSARCEAFLLMLEPHSKLQCCEGLPEPWTTTECCSLVCKSLSGNIEKLSDGCPALFAPEVSLNEFLKQTRSSEAIKITSSGVGAEAQCQCVCLSLSLVTGRNLR